MASEVESRTVVAAFDVDGTLTTRDAVVPFLVEVAGWRRVIWAFVRRPLSLLRRDRDAIKASLVGVLAGRPVADVDTIARRFVEQRMTGWLRPDTVTMLQQHRVDGHQVVLVSASMRPYLNVLAAHLQVPDVLCCELEIFDGRYTGAIAGANCRGPEKVNRLRTWLGHDPSSITLYAYGDSSGDDDMLAAATHAFRVGKAVVPA